MTYNILVLGDSILWGQGLSEKRKMTWRVKEHIRARTGREVKITRYAHSGADVWDPNGTGLWDWLDPTPPELPDPPKTLTDREILAYPVQSSPDAVERDRVGEIPTGEPFTLAQLLAAAKELPKDGVDLVLVDGGINDVNAFNIVMPHKDVKALSRRTESFRGYMFETIRRIHEKFPAARIVVTGYYPIASEDTNFGRLFKYQHELIRSFRLPDRVLWQGFGFDNFHHAVEDALSGIPSRRGLMGRVSSPEDHLVRLSKVFSETIHTVLQQDVDLYNQRAGDTVARLAWPDFAPENSLYASRSYLWDLAGPELVPQDDVADARLDVCKTGNRPSPVEFVCQRASMSHPNAQGAIAYADAVLSAWDMWPPPVVPVRRGRVTA